VTALPVTITLSLAEAREVAAVLEYSAVPTMENGGAAVDAALLQVSARRAILKAIVDAYGESDFREEDGE
jgi:hypothetical protein